MEIKGIPLDIMHRQAFPNAGALLHVTGCLMMAICAAIGLVTLHAGRPLLPATTVGLAAGAAMVLLVRRGATRAAAVLLCGGLLLSAATGSFLNYGFYGPVWILVPIAVMVSGWLLGGKAAVATAALATLDMLFIYALHRQGHAFAHEVPPAPLLALMVAATWMSAYTGLKLADHLRHQMQVASAAQSHLEAIFDGTQDLIWSVRLGDFRLLSFNQAFGTFVQANLDVQASSGQQLEDYFADGQQRQTWVTLFRRTLEQGFHTVEYPFSNDRTLLLSFNLLRDHGQVVGISAIGKEITARKRAEREVVRQSEALALAQAELERAQAIAQIGSWELEIASGKAKWSTQSYRIFGLEPGTLVDHELFISRVHPDDLPGVEAGWQAAARQEHGHEHQFRISVDGKVRWIHNRIEFEYDKGGQLKSMFGTMQDITERRLAQQLVLESEERMRLAAEAVHFGIFDCDLFAGTTYWSAETRALFGVPADTPAPPPGQVGNFVHPDDVVKVEQSLARALDPDGDGVLECTHRLLQPDGTLRWIRHSGRTRFEGQGAQRQAVRLHGIVLDVTEQRQVSERIEFLALHDALTGLPNRVFGQERLQQAVALASRQHGRLAVLNLDLDKFKLVNDTHGHAVGDKLLESVAQRLRSCLREEDTLCRLSGDEFMVVLPDLQGPNHASNTCERILSRLAQPFELEDVQLNTSFSIGVALYPQDGGDGQSLLKNADMALYEAKRAGRNAWRFFEPQMNASLMRYLELRADLGLALERGEFELHYQPQFDLKSGQPIGVEALLRWSRPGHGLVMPTEFIAAAEDSGLIVPIGRWVLHQACRQAAVWQASGWPQLIISVNLSTVQLRQGQIEHDVEAALAASGIAPQTLELELTESVLLQHDEAVMAALQRLGQRGVRLAIDDFGTGYSNLSYLKRFNLDKLKIDRSFVRDLDGDDRIIVQAMLQMARNLQIRTIAEGVESAAAAQRLQDMGCDEVQGYLYARPMPAAALESWLAAAATAPA
jgi:diguanylate cyclase (GGDEF)-like protein/PAS domain S-box-containing protein